MAVPINKLVILLSVPFCLRTFLIDLYIYIYSLLMSFVSSLDEFRISLPGLEHMNVTLEST